jgi:hypothetical protein
VDITLAEAVAAAIAAALTDASVAVTVDPRVNEPDLTGWAVRVMPWEAQDAARWRDRDQTTRRLLLAVVGPATADQPAAVEAGLGLMDRAKALFAPGGALRDVELQGHVFRPPLTAGPLLKLESLLTDRVCAAVVVATYDYWAEA